MAGRRRSGWQWQQLVLRSGVISGIMVFLSACGATPEVAEIPDTPKPATELPVSVIPVGPTTTGEPTTELFATVVPEAPATELPTPVPIPPPTEVPAIVIPTATVAPVEVNVPSDHYSFDTPGVLDPRAVAKNNSFGQVAGLDRPACNLSEQVTITDEGFLAITAEERKPDQNLPNDCLNKDLTEYVSGMVEFPDLVLKPGQTISIRTKFESSSPETHSGTLLSFWASSWSPILDGVYQWPLSGEVDPFELRPGAQNGLGGFRSNHALHFATSVVLDENGEFKFNDKGKLIVDGKDQDNDQFYFNEDGSFSDTSSEDMVLVEGQWVEYSMHWSETGDFEFYINNIPVLTIPAPETVSEFPNPFLPEDQANGITGWKLTNYVERNIDGHLPFDPAAFPSRFLIDWIRVDNGRPAQNRRRKKSQHRQICFVHKLTLEQMAKQDVADAVSSGSSTKLR